jgi:hypothetical protein
VRIREQETHCYMFHRWVWISPNNISKRLNPKYLVNNALDYRI